MLVEHERSWKGAHNDNGKAEYDDREKENADNEFHNASQSDKDCTFADSALPGTQSLMNRIVGALATRPAQDDSSADDEVIGKVD